MAGSGQDTDEAFLPAPRQLGQYEVIAEIARGGMGVVYLARRVSEAGFARLFAVKVLHAHLALEHAFIEMLHDEARIAARVHHPHVVPIVDLGEADGFHYVVMEYVDGCALSALMARNKASRSPELVGAIMLDALEGLHSAHTLLDDAGVPLALVHRDVTPQNILVGADGAARITDFGIAKAEARVTTTQPGTWKGKFSYIAPEALTGDAEKVDLRADIFSAGAVLWSALTGRSLFRAETDGATLHNVLNKEVPKASQTGLCPPESLDAVCSKALERNPDRRFQSALEMAEALRAALPRVGRRAEVAEWVSASFEGELARRRAAIRAAASKPGATLPPPLPSLGPESMRTDSWPVPGSSEHVSGPGLAVTTLSPHADTTPIVASRPSRRRLLAIATGILALTAVAVVIGFSVAGTEDPASDLPSAATRAGAPPAQEASDPAPTAEPAPRAIATPSALPLESVRPTPRRSAPAVRAALPSPGPPPSTASEPKAPFPVATPNPSAPPASTKGTPPAPEMVYEKNPYLKRN
ncbi:MAG TPA: protein kinase [Polyangiaceae bacterium]|nr:protein kinase [Polyangiaceae bacterium]